MNLARASQRAVTIRRPKSAARVYNDIEYELALGEPDDGLESLGEQALTLLRSVSQAYGKRPRDRAAAEPLAPGQ